VRAEAATRLAALTLAGARSHDAARLRFIFKSLTGRPPTTSELAVLGDHFREVRSTLPADDKQLWVRICADLFDHPFCRLR
jgi:hypothetical protein